jgi:hypothetical protein
MIEIFTSGFFVGRPHGIGAGGAVIMSESGEIGRVKRMFGSSELSSSIAAELAVLADALEKAHGAGGGGEAVVVRTGFASLADLCRGRIPRGSPDLRDWIDRVGEVAKNFAEIRAVVSPGWVTARPHDLAVRAVLDQFREARGGSTDNRHAVGPTSPISRVMPPENVKDLGEGE